MLEAILNLYSPKFPNMLAFMLQSTNYETGKYLKLFWRTQKFSEIEKTAKNTSTKATKLLVLALKIAIALELLAGLLLIYLWHWHNLTGGLAFGLALIVGYPIIWAHLTPLVARAVSKLVWFNPKYAGKAFICSILESQVISLRNRHKIKVIAVAGSVGKTSTKLAIAQTLSVGKKVIYQEGNYNDRITVPLIFFGQNLPGLFNIFAWLKLIIADGRKLKADYPYDCVVVELGTDAPGQMAKFAYLKPDITVVTAVAPEHMEFFGSLEAVAHEELSVFDYSEQILVNVDDTPREYLENKTFKGYGFSESADFRIISWRSKKLQGSSALVKLADKKELSVDFRMIGKQGAKISVAAASVAKLLGFDDSEIVDALKNVEPFAGRLKVLNGIKDSLIIDDSYNASPVAVKAGLDVLYGSKTEQRIAILGSMNELGGYSKQAHQEVGQYCDKQKLNLVVTIGAEAKKYLAPAATKAGCKVESFKSPYDAGDFVKNKLKAGAVILAEGSQNGVFAEESLKSLLANTEDEAKLVRQSKSWMEIKNRQFKS